MAVGTATAILGAGALGAGASFLSGKGQADAAGDAAALQAQVNYQIWSEQRDDAERYREQDLNRQEAARSRSLDATRDARQVGNEQAGEAYRTTRAQNVEGAQARLTNERNNLGAQLDQLRNAAGLARADRRSGFNQAVRYEDNALADALGEVRRGEDVARGDIQSGFAQDRADTQALRDLSTGAQNQLAIQLGLAEGDSAFETQPGYQFLQDEARDQLQGSAAAGGGLYSGATMKALQDRAQDIASLEYNTYLDRLSQAAANTAPLLGAAEGQALANVTGQAATNSANLQSGAGQRKAGYANALGESMAAGAERAGSAYAGTIDASGAATDAIINDKVNNNMQITDLYHNRISGNADQHAANRINIEQGAGTAASNTNQNALQTMINASNNYRTGQVNANNLALQGQLAGAQATGNAFNQLVGAGYTALTYQPTQMANSGNSLASNWYNGIY